MFLINNDHKKNSLHITFLLKRIKKSKQDNNISIVACDAGN